MHHVHHDLKVYGGIKLFAGTGSPELGQKIADYLDQPVSERQVIEFPNENLFVKLGGSVRGQDVYVIQTTSSPVHRNLMELLIMIQTLRLDSAARITAVVPYLCYGRSDKKDQPRVPITARLVADMIEVAGADRYMTLDPHAGQVQGFFSIPGDVLTASHLLDRPYQQEHPRRYARTLWWFRWTWALPKKDATMPRIWTCPSRSSKNAVWEMTPKPKR